MWSWLNKKFKNADVDWAEEEIKRYTDSLNKKREKAIQYLGNKWILNGGECHWGNTPIGKK